MDIMAPGKTLTSYGPIFNSIKTGQGLLYRHVTDQFFLGPLRDTRSFEKFSEVY